MNADQNPRWHPVAAPSICGHSSATVVENEFVYLHLVRGLAALAVMAGHARAFILVDYDKLSDPSIAAGLFYLATGLGHQAVIVFFVLSGFLITGSVLDRVRRGQWSWLDYAVARLSRLWVVLIPSLFAALFWDRLGMAIEPDGFYSGAFGHIYHSGPPGPGGVSHTAGVFLANLFFLQTIAAPTYGSNGPLWSLANEFWYYVVFPLGFFAMFGGTAAFSRLCLAAGALAVCLLLPSAIVVLGLTWLFGAFVAVWYRHEASDRGALHTAVAAGLTILFVISLAAAKIYSAHGQSVDIAIGASAAVLVAALVRLDRRGMRFQSSVRLLSSMSYTMYLFHFPLFAFLAVGILAQQKMPLATAGIASFAAFMAAGLVYSWVAYLMFERNTGWVRRRINSIVNANGRHESARHEQ